MARLLYRDRDGGEGTIELSTSEPVFVGRGADCAIRTASGLVSRRHSQIRMENGRFVIEDLGSSNGTFVNDVRIQKHVFAHADLAQCGSLYIRFVDESRPHSPAETPVPPDEAALLADIARGDDASRLVYADWLEQHADLERAEYVRLQEALAHAVGGARPVLSDDARIVRLRELAPAIPIAWRTQIANARTGDPCAACGNLSRMQRVRCHACNPPPLIANPPPPAKQCACGVRNSWYATTCESCGASL
ncbi:MAG: FHA domain-containing protein [Proteobacteria bacterium]|nr:FHA domain-containing protein [Pseudomonadota bacterium]